MVRQGENTVMGYLISRNPLSEAYVIPIRDAFEQIEKFLSCCPLSVRFREPALKFPTTLREFVDLMRQETARISNTISNLADNVWRN